MNILLTGGSSFSGLWFARALAADGHRVIAALRRAEAAYGEDLRGRRVAALGEVAERVWDCPFGEARFRALAGSRAWDLLCHHAARVGDYRSPDFDVAGALAENTRELAQVLRLMAGRGLRGVVLTGSVFEADEGAGSAPLRAFSPYGVSKGLTAQVFRYWCGALGLPLGKFVIPNPFGPFEEARFCAYLLRCWTSGDTASVQTPAYVRDNIHVDLLAGAYARFANAVADGPLFIRTNPSGYVESQGSFAQRVATAVRERTGLACSLSFATQTEFAEPAVRLNTEPAAASVRGWDEAKAWDGFVDFYALR